MDAIYACAAVMLLVGFLMLLIQERPEEEYHHGQGHGHGPAAGAPPKHAPSNMTVTTVATTAGDTSDIATARSGSISQMKSAA